MRAARSRAVAALVLALAVAACATAASAQPTLTPRQVYARAAAGVVDIKVTAIVSSPFGQREAEGEGAGFVLDAKGHIATNEHVVDGATSITVRFKDGTSAAGKVVGSDASADVAVVAVTVAKSRLHPLTLGALAGVAPGDPVVAIGSPFGFAWTITAGIVSAIGRTISAPDDTPIGNAIQTDAPLNSGNSGGPLLDTQARVIGMNAQISTTGRGNEDVGFAIPVTTVRKVVARLIAEGARQAAG